MIIFNSLLQGLKGYQGLPGVPGRKGLPVSYTSGWNKFLEFKFAQLAQSYIQWDAPDNMAKDIMQIFTSHIHINLEKFMVNVKYVVNEIE